MDLYCPLTPIQNSLFNTKIKYASIVSSNSTRLINLNVKTEIDQLKTLMRSSSKTIYQSNETTPKIECFSHSGCIIKTQTF